MTLPKYENNSRIVLAMVAVILLLNCYVPLTNASSTAHHIKGVPLVDQGDMMWCGPGCVTMMLQYWHRKITLEEVGQAIDPEDDGCNTDEIIAYLISFNVNIYEFNSMDELKDWISKGHPAIVLQWTDETRKTGHYRLVIGYDADYVYVNDPHGYTEKFTYDVFLLLWTKCNEYGLTVSPSISFVSDPYSPSRSVTITKKKSEVEVIS